MAGAMAGMLADNTGFEYGVVFQKLNDFCDRMGGIG